jgi:hypothetical protein
MIYAKVATLGYYPRFDPTNTDLKGRTMSALFAFLGTIAGSSLPDYIIRFITSDLLRALISYMIRQSLLIFNL